MRLNLYQTAVYWAPAGADDFGRPAYASPEEQTVRWEDAVTETIAPDGSTVLSGATVYLAAPVRVGGVMYLGELADVESEPNPLSVGREIINASNTPNLWATQSLTTAKLR